MDSLTCSGAARGGHLDVRVCLRANGYRWIGWVRVCAAERGRLDRLKWLPICPQPLQHAYE